MAAASGSLFDCLEVGADLTLGCAVDTLVSDVLTPPAQVFIDLGQAGEGFALQGVVFDVFDGCFDLALVGRCVGARGQDHGAVVRGKVAQLGVELGFIPVGLVHGGF